MNRNRTPAQPDPARWLYGRHAVEAALANPARRVQRMLALRETADEAKTLIQTAEARVPRSGAEIMERTALEKLLPRDAVHQGLALMVEPLEAPAFEALIAAPGAQTIVVLDQVTDPHNVGAILRSAAAFGVSAVIVPENGAPPVTGTLAKSASGALEKVPLIRVTNLARAMEQLKKAEYWLVGLAEEATETLPALKLPPRMALLLGAEGVGLRRLTRENCDYLAKLPTRDAMASLNVSNAAAVALYVLSVRTPS